VQGFLYSAQRKRRNAANGAMQMSQYKRRNANGATQRNDETKPCKTRAKQTGFTCLLLYTVGSRRIEE